MNVRLLSFAIVTMAFDAFSQVSTTAKDAQREQTPAVLDAVQGGWNYQGDSNYHQKQDPEKKEAGMDVQRVEKLNELRARRNSALARGQGQLTAADRAELERIAGEMNTVDPQSCESHLAGFYAEFPAPASFMHVDLATANAPDRQEVIAPQLVNSARKDDHEALVKWGTAMKQRGEVAPPLYKLAEDILLSVEKNGVLIAAGEMDAYPLWVEQFADGERNDVLVIDQRLLGDPAYRTRMWARLKAKGTSPSDAAIFVDQLPKATDRPVFLSLAVGMSLAAKYKGALCVTGLAMRFGEAKADDMRNLEQRWKQMNKPTDAGPLSRNYLLPGSLLLKYHREQNEEEKAALLEAELRTMAARTNATNLMYANGVFQH